MTNKRELTIYASAVIEIHANETAPADIYQRAAESDFPYSDRPEGGLSAAGLHQHLAHNALSNGVTDISQLDGFADFPRDAVTLTVGGVEVDSTFSSQVAS